VENIRQYALVEILVDLRFQFHSLWNI
jgi:hypothetical protein